MNKLVLILSMTAIVGSLLQPPPIAAQIPPPAKRTASIRITEGPALESGKDNWAIISWTSTNPGGMDDHFGVVHYGTRPDNLSETARNHIRLNRGHSSSVFRVILNGLKPGTTYYYTVSSMGADGKDDEVKSAVARFTTTAGGQ